MNRQLFRNGMVALLVVLTLNFSALAQSDNAAFPHIKIKNFGQMDDRFYRGAQPKENDYKDLAALGIKTVIDLRHEAEEYAKPIVESLGMKYVNIPMIAKKYPKEEHVAAFLSLINEPATGKFYVHCAGGRHRTGTIGAVYRFNFYDWNYDQVYREMKDYDYYSRWGHGDFKKYVQEYWQRVQTHQVIPTTAASVTSILQ